MTYIPQFFVKQKIALATHRFDILASGPDGQPGQLLCTAQQKRLALKERVTFFADEARTQPVFSFGARNVVDLRGTYDVFDEHGKVLATFSKKFGASLLRSTFTLEGPGYAGTGQEKQMVVAVLRRFSEIPMLPVDFEYVDSQGTPLFDITKSFGIRDRYTVRVADQRVDFRVAAAMAVAMDVLVAH